MTTMAPIGPIPVNTPLLIERRHIVPGIFHSASPVVLLKKVYAISIQIQYIIKAIGVAECSVRYYEERNGYAA